VNLPAQFEGQKTETLAEAQRLKYIRQGEADSFATTSLAQAEAAVTIAKGQAESRTVSLKAEAFKQFGEAAVIEQMIAMIPKVTSAITNEISKVGGIIFINDYVEDEQNLALETVDKKGKKTSR